jgi:hypothetical protein
MKNMGIKRLDWDSDFFGFEVGEFFDETIVEGHNKYKLVIAKQLKDKELLIKNFENRFQETKVIYKKNIN